MAGQIFSVECPSGHQQTVEFPVMLQADKHPDLREGILEGIPGALLCSTCQQGFQVELAGVYIDVPRRQFVLLRRPSELGQWKGLEAELERRFQADIPVERRGPSSRPWLKRLVFGFAALKEKLNLWESGLDDRLLEIIRLQAVQSAAGVARPSARELPALTAIDLERSRLSFRWLEPGPLQGKMLHLPLPQYDALESKRDTLAKQVPALFTNPFVDARRLLAPA